MVIVKNRDATDNWIIYHEFDNATPESGFMLFTTSAFYADARAWGGPIGAGSGTQPSSTVVTIGANNSGVGYTNGNGNKYIAYCFHSVDGFSKFGKYTGNGSTDGPFVYTGFRPAFVMIKRSDAADNWVLLDSGRNPYNVVNARLFADLAQADGTTDSCDFTSNGFKVKTTASWINASSGTLIFMAFAEMPFKYANAR